MTICVNEKLEVKIQMNVKTFEVIFSLEYSIRNLAHAPLWIGAFNSNLETSTEMFLPLHLTPLPPFSTVSVQAPRVVCYRNILSVAFLFPRSCNHICLHASTAQCFEDFFAPIIGVKRLEMKSKTQPFSRIKKNNNPHQESPHFVSRT